MMIICSGDRFVFTWVAELIFGEFDDLQIDFEWPDLMMYVYQILQYSLQRFLGH